jgi:hypothetical protein
MRHHLRKYLWKLMMVKCQQMDIYIKGLRKGFPAEDLPGYQHNYNPNGWNAFEDDARCLREFFEGIEDYPSLEFEGHFFISPVGHNLVLSSKKEVLAYVCSPTGIDDFTYTPRGVQFRLADLPLTDGQYTALFFDPKSGPAGSRTVRIRKGTTNFRSQDFVDDYMVRIVRQ